MPIFQKNSKKFTRVGEKENVPVQQLQQREKELETDLCLGRPGRLCFSDQCPLELGGQDHVLQVNSENLHSPILGPLLNYLLQ